MRGRSDAGIEKVGNSSGKWKIAITIVFIELALDNGGFLHVEDGPSLDSCRESKSWSIILLME